MRRKKTFIEAAGEQTWFEHRPAGEALCYTDLNHLVKHPKKYILKNGKLSSTIRENASKMLDRYILFSKSFQKIYVVRGKVNKKNKLANKKCADSYCEVNESGS